MARINVDKRILDNVKQDDIAAVLNQLIDDELAKDVDKIDTDFVDECVNALLEIEQQEDGNFLVLVPLMSSEKFLKKISSTGFSPSSSTSARPKPWAMLLISGKDSGNFTSKILMPQALSSASWMT